MASFRVKRKRMLLVLFFSCELIDPILTALVRADFADLFCNTLILFFLFYVMVTEPRSVKGYSFLLLILSIGAFVFSYIAHPEYSSVMFEEYNIWKRVFAIRKGLFFMLILSLEDNPDEVFETLKISAIPIWIIYSTRVIMGIGLSEATGNNHAYGYIFMFVSLIYAVFYIRERKILDFLVSIVSFCEMIIVASRMTLVAYVLFWTLYIFIYETEKKKIGKKIIGLISALIVALVITSNWFLIILQSLMTQLGLRSKIITAIITGNNALDGGREYMYSNNLILLRQNPLGLGVYWDRYIYYRYNYTHNIVFEMLLDFGWLIGGALLISLLMNSIKILRSNDKEWKLLFIFYFSLCMVRLMLSYSFWFDNNFWGMIAVIISYRYFCKRRKRLNSI